MEAALQLTLQMRPLCTEQLEYGAITGRSTEAVQQIMEQPGLSLITVLILPINGLLKYELITVLRLMFIQVLQVFFIIQPTAVITGSSGTAQVFPTGLRIFR